MRFALSYAFFAHTFTSSWIVFIIAYHLPANRARNTGLYFLLRHLIDKVRKQSNVNLISK